jgi:hypothetical protein
MFRGQAIKNKVRRWSNEGFMGGTAMKLLSISAVSGAAILMFGCAAWVAANSDSNIYYKSQKEADLALSQFDINNPKCQLWTNWQKMCSRTGEDGATYCQKAKSIIKPSTPFCSAENDEPYLGLVGNYMPKQLISYLRFCESKTGEISPEKVPLCNWKRKRPFNGLNIAERKHPWCKSWKLTVPISTNAELSKKMGYYCADRAIPSWCSWADGLGYGKQNNEKPTDKDIIPASLNPASLPINGQYCRGRASYASK